MAVRNHERFPTIRITAFMVATVMILLFTVLLRPHRVRPSNIASPGSLGAAYRNALLTQLGGHALGR